MQVAVHQVTPALLGYDRAQRERVIDLQHQRIELHEEFVGGDEDRHHRGESIGHHGLHRALARHQRGHHSRSVTHRGDVRTNRLPDRLKPAHHAAIGPDAEGDRASFFPGKSVDRRRLNDYRGKLRQGRRDPDHGSRRGRSRLAADLNEDRLGLPACAHYDLGGSGADSSDGSGSFHDHDRIIGGVEGQTQDGVAVAIEGLNREPLLLPDCERQGIGADIELGDTLRPAQLGPGEEDHGWDQEMSKCFHDSSWSRLR